MTIRELTLLHRAQQRFERTLWRLRLVAILPVIMSLASTGVTFLLGTIEIGGAVVCSTSATSTSSRRSRSW